MSGIWGRVLALLWGYLWALNKPFRFLKVFRSIRCKQRNKVSLFFSGVKDKGAAVTIEGMF